MILMYMYQYTSITISYIHYMELDSTIAISRNTRDMLKQLGHKGETYDQLIKNLIKLKGNVSSSSSQDSLDHGVEPETSESRTK
jgi:hypothetical protein